MQLAAATWAWRIWWRWISITDARDLLKTGAFSCAPCLSPSCNSCHGSATPFEVEFESCGTCHQGEPHRISEFSRQSYDGKAAYLGRDSGLTSKQTQPCFWDTVESLCRRRWARPIILWTGHNGLTFFADCETVDGVIGPKAWVGRGLITVGHHEPARKLQLETW